MKKLLMIVTFAIMAVGTGYTQTYSKELEGKAMNGDKLAMMELGYCYQSGSGIQQDYAKAMAWYLKVLDGKERYGIGAEWTIGYLYDKGLGVPKDTYKAMEWWRKGCHYNYIRAMIHYESWNDYKLPKDLFRIIVDGAQKSFFKYTKALADKGDVSAMVDMALCYANWIGVKEEDNKKAFQWSLKAAEKGDTTAMVMVANNWPSFHKEYFNKYEVAESWYKKAIDKGSRTAMWRLIDFYSKIGGIGIEYTEKAFEYKKKYALIENDPKLVNEIGRMYYFGYEDSTSMQKEFNWVKVEEWYDSVRKQGQKPYNYDISWGVVRNYEKAFEWYQKAANLNYGEAMMQIGYMLFIGIGTNKDEVKAFEWTKKAAVQGNATACSNLAVYYRNQDNTNQAIEWYKKAAEYGSKDALYNVGAMYYNSHDTVQARYWWQKAKDNGNPYGTFGIGRLCYDAKDYASAYDCFKTSQGENHPNTMYCLGMMYKDGIKVQKDLNKAFELFKQAAESTNKNVNSDAMQMLSTCYRFGFGTSKDLDKAEYWLKKAQEAGNNTARGIMLLMEEGSSISSETN